MLFLDDFFNCDKNNHIVSWINGSFWWFVCSDIAMVYIYKFFMANKQPYDDEEDDVENKYEEIHYDEDDIETDKDEEIPMVVLQPVYLHE